MIARRISLAVALVTSSIALGLVGYAALAAPVPIKKPPAELTSHDMEGDWRLEWGAGSGSCRLDPSGAYTEVWYGTRWVGSWKYDQGKHTLSVTEQCVSEDGSLGGLLIWTATLQRGTRQGKLQNDGYFSLKKSVGEKLKMPREAKPDA